VVDWLIDDVFWTVDGVKKVSPTLKLMPEGVTFAAMVADRLEELGKAAWLTPIQIPKPATIVPPSTMLRATTLLCLIFFISHSPLLLGYNSSIERDY
jgi:hypothetical protein